MGYVEYKPEVKAICVRMLISGRSPASINRLIGYNISTRSFTRWKSLYLSTQSVIRDPETYEPRGRPLLLNKDEVEFVLEILKADPTLYLDELQTKMLAKSGVELSRSTVFNLLTKRLGQTRKVARTVHPAQSLLKRASYSIGVSAYPAEFLVFADESSICLKTQQRVMGWSEKGERTPRVPAKRTPLKYSLLPAVGLAGPVGIMVQQGSILRLDFEYYLEEVLLANMNPFPARQSVLVIDNARIHHLGRIPEICERHRVLLLYLPPYSPDFNPIEKVFSVFKKHLKREGTLTGTRSDAEVIRRDFQRVATPQLLHSLYLSCGYIH